MNIIIVIMDSLRQDHVGAYGNKWIKTPHLDTFASESVMFTRCYPESMPTLQFRKTIHTGRRVFPFKEDKQPKGDAGPAPGWSPIPDDHETLAEMLTPHGYRSALITDTYHQFKPSCNFHRGFDSWEWIRGQETDRFRSGPKIFEKEIFRHINDRSKDHQGVQLFLRLCMQNASDRRTEEDYYAAQVFRAGANWLYKNQDAEKFFLVVDSFDPHEPWDPPVYYRKMYDPEDDVLDMVLSPYCPWEDVMDKRELKRLQANYAGEVTMTDRWFGHFMETLRVSGRLDDTVVAVMSDHGHNLGYDPKDKGFVDKHGHPMTRAVADLVMMIRHPLGEGAGTVCHKLAYNHDIVRTLMNLAGIEPGSEMDGKDIWPVVMGKNIEPHDYLVYAWGSNIVVLKDKWWYNANVFGEGSLLFNVADDPDLLDNVADEHPDVCKSMLELAVQEAGGQFPEEKFRAFTKKPNSRLWRFGQDGETYCSTIPLSTIK